MSYSQEELAHLHETLGADAEEEFPPVRIQFASGGSCPDDVVLCGMKCEDADGKPTREVALGFVMYDHTTKVPVIDILKLAIQRFPELVQRAHDEVQQANA